MYIILKGSCNVHVDPTFDESAQAGALQKASLQPKVPKKKTPLTKAHLSRLNSTMRLERMSSNLSVASRRSSVGGDSTGADKKNRTTLLSKALLPIFRSLAHQLTDVGLGYTKE